MRGRQCHSRAQARGGDSRKGLHGKTFCSYYTTKTPCFQQVSAYFKIKFIISTAASRRGDSNLPLCFHAKSCFFQKALLSAGIMMFESCLLYSFVLSLQSKETQKYTSVLGLFLLLNAKTGFGVAKRPLPSPFFYYSPCIIPGKQEKTSLVLVDKRGFFFGAENGT